MDTLDPLSQVTGGNAPSPLLLIMELMERFCWCVDHFPNERRTEQGWFKESKEDDE
ncbi:hypothetical protein [Prochlorococcus sp. MIT 1341]|uniref:hypothetical protein n=1 Tax=Prochlorococcus sp. MIT 1341 TaxID=3096221 RepID=UPI002A753B57|nr:hypothetical protein [Prochlorococcus sp. MIT 1341]